MTKVKLEDIALERKEICKKCKDNYPIVGLDDLAPEEVLLASWKHGSDNTFTKIFHKGDILFGRRRAYLKKASVAPVDGICSGDITVIQAMPKHILPELLPFVIQNDAFFDFAVGKSAGSLSPRVKWEHLKNYEFELPSMDKQRELAELLWAMNLTKETYKELLSATDELVKSRFIEMFGDPEKNDKAVSFETAFIVRDDLRKPLNDAVRSEMHSGQLYPYYGANGQVDSINEYLMDCDAICLAEDCGAYGPGEQTSYIVSGKCWVNNHAHILIPKASCDIEFANAYFRILDMTKYVVGSTRLKLTQTNMKTIPMILPPIQAQKQFAKFVQQSDKSKFDMEQALTELRSVYKQIMKENIG